MEEVFCIWLTPIVLILLLNNSSTLQHLFRQATMAFDTTKNMLVFMTGDIDVNCIIYQQHV
jgi:hypothetical protein